MAVTGRRKNISGTGKSIPKISKGRKISGGRVGGKSLSTIKKRPR